MRRIPAIAILLVLAGAAPSLESQERRPRPTRVSVTLVLVDSLPDPGVYRILRRWDTSPHDVILLSRRATEPDLSAAVRDLLLLRSVQGDTARESGIGRVRRTASAPPRPLPLAHRVLHRLGRESAREIAGVGTVPAVEIWLPATRSRLGRGGAPPNPRPGHVRANRP